MYDIEIDRFLERHHYMSVIPKAALIDMDGTLYDSMPNHARSWHRMVSELGISCTPEEFFMYEGRTGASTIDIIFQREYGRHATEEEVRELYRRKTEYFKELPEPKPMPGADEMLDFMEQVGIKRVLVTGSGQSSLIGRLDSDFPGAFPENMRITSKNVTHGKPHPEPFIKAMQLARVSPSQCIAIENAPLGVKSADTAGAFTVAVITGPIPRTEFENAGAAIIFNSMRECARNLPLLVYGLITRSRNLN